MPNGRTVLRVCTERRKTERVYGSGERECVCEKTIQRTKVKCERSKEYGNGNSVAMLTSSKRLATQSISTLDGDSQIVACAFLPIRYIIDINTHTHAWSGRTSTFRWHTLCTPTTFESPVRFRLRVSLCIMCGRACVC